MPNFVPAHTHAHTHVHACIRMYTRVRTRQDPLINHGVCPWHPRGTPKDSTGAHGVTFCTRTTRACKCTHAYSNMYAQILACKRTHANMHTHACMHAYVPAHAERCMRTGMCMDVVATEHANAYMRTNARMHQFASAGQILAQWGCSTIARPTELPGTPREPLGARSVPR